MLVTRKGSIVTKSEFHVRAILADLVCVNHSPAIDCRHGMVFFTHEDEDYDRLLEKAKESPDKYFESQDDQVAWGYFQGSQVAFDCPKCNEQMGRCQDWLVENEEVVRSFLKQLGQERLNEAKRLAEIE